MGISAAGKKCPICGQWISTDTPRFASRRGSSARDVLQKEFLIHLRTNHPDYLRWSRPYQVLGIGLIVLETVFVVVASSLSGPFLLIAILLPVVLGIPLVVVYRREFKAFKNQWNDEHSLSPTS